MINFKDQGVLWSDLLGLPKRFRRGVGTPLSTVLFHHFRFGDESWGAARERLKRQLGFLQDTYECIDVSDVAVSAQHPWDLAKSPLLLTIDDAKREFLDVADVFAAFEIPVLHFVCAGWSERSTGPGDPAGLKLRLAANLHFYIGPERSIEISGKGFALNHTGNAALIDAIIETADPEDLVRAAELDLELSKKETPDTVCDWSELKDLQGGRITFGCHSVSHPYIAQQTKTRQMFEITAAQSFIERHLGHCPYFAYPFGTAESHNRDTYAILKQQGFALGFTTAPDVSFPDADHLVLPRLTLPDSDMSDRIFRARIRGGNIPFNKFKALLR